VLVHNWFETNDRDHTIRALLILDKVIACGFESAIEAGAFLTLCNFSPHIIYIIPDLDFRLWSFLHVEKPIGVPVKATG
jgi:hypothetical protein